MTWDTQPSFAAPVLSSVGAVQSGDVVEFDVTGAITRGDGAYCFAIDSLSTDPVNYNSLEASTGQRPQFLVGVAP
jgi:hypothetical protein